MMELVAVSAAMGLLACAAQAQDQKASAPAESSHEALAASCNPATTGTVQTYFLNNATAPNDGLEIQAALRNILPPQIRIFFTANENAVTICALPEQQALAAKLIHDLDKPRKSYRLTYTFTETDADKRVGTQHYTMIVSAGERTQMKVGSKVPLATGTYSSASTPGVQTQFQYVDIGMNFDATFTEASGGGLLKTKVEESSAEESKTISGVTEPVMRELSFEGSPMLVLGKPAILGTVDAPESTRHVEVEVMAEEVK